MRTEIKVLVGVLMVWLFIYLDFFGKDTYASQLFGSLMSIVWVVFWIDQWTKMTNNQNQSKDKIGFSMPNQK